MERFKSFGMIFMLFFLLLLGQGTAGSAERETLKIGMIGPFSGGAITFGTMYKVSVEIAIDEIRERGGLKVGNKIYDIELIAYDDKYMAEPGFAAATRLVYEDKVKFIMGPISSASLLAIQPTTEKEKVLVFADSYSMKALSPQNPFTFRWLATVSEFSTPEIVWLAKKYPHLKNVVILATNDESGRETLAANRKGYENAGVKVLGVEFYERNMPDMQPLITKVMRRNPDWLEVNGSAPGDIANIARTARQMNYKGQITKIAGGGEGAIPAAPEALEGFIFHIDADVEGATGRLGNFYKETAKRRSGQIQAFGAESYSAFMMLCEAIQNAGTVEDTDAVRVALEQIKDFDGLVGKMNWTGKETYGIDHQLYCDTSYLAKAVNGKPEILGKIKIK